MKASHILTLILVVAIAFVLVRVYLNRTEQLEAHPATNELAVTADEMLEGASYYLQEEYRKTSINYVERAIEAIRIMENDCDTTSIIALETSIADLEILKEAILNKENPRPELERSFAQALNSLALAQLRVCRDYYDKGAYGECMTALVFADQHLENALNYTAAEQLDKENKMYRIVDYMVYGDDVTDDHLRLGLDYVIGSLDSLLIAGSTD